MARFAKGVATLALLASCHPEAPLTPATSPPGTGPIETAATRIVELPGAPDRANIGTTIVPGLGATAVWTTWSASAVSESLQVLPPDGAGEPGWIGSTTHGGVIEAASVTAFADGAVAWLAMSPPRYTDDTLGWVYRAPVGVGSSRIADVHLLLRAEAPKLALADLDGQGIERLAVAHRPATDRVTCLYTGADIDPGDSDCFASGSGLKTVSGLTPDGRDVLAVTDAESGTWHLLDDVSAGTDDVLATLVDASPIDSGFDANGDGHADLLLRGQDGALMLAPGPIDGAVHASSLVDRYLEAAGTSTGHSVAVAGDLDGDGVVDLAIGRRYLDPESITLPRGAVHIVPAVMNGVTELDAVGYRLDGEDPAGRWAEWAADELFGGSDVDGDGVPDLLVQANNAQRLYVVPGWRP